MRMSHGAAERSRTVHKRRITGCEPEGLASLEPIYFQLKISGHGAVLQISLHSFTLVIKNAVRRAFQIFVLARFQTPHEGDKAQCAKRERHGDEDKQIGHNACISVMA
jgi:hypothetical protein